MKPDSRILYCRCAYAGTLPPHVKQEVRQALRESGLSHCAVPDLCELAARKAPLLAELAGASRLTIAACHPRAVKWIFAAGGAPLRDEAVEYLDMREASAEQLLGSIRDLATSGEEDSSTSFPRPDPHPAAAPEDSDAARIASSALVFVCSACMGSDPTGRWR
jgi:hypothetical protein